MLNYLVAASIKARGAVIAALVLLLLVGVWAARTLPIDAMPDVSTVQVSVLTSASGLSPVEIERIAVVGYMPRPVRTFLPVETFDQTSAIVWDGAAPTNIEFADGSVLGTTPVTFQMVPRQILLKL